MRESEGGMGEKEGEREGGREEKGEKRYLGDMLSTSPTTIFIHHRGLFPSIPARWYLQLWNKEPGYSFL